MKLNAEQKRMNRLMRIVNAGYPDGLILRCWDKKNARPLDFGAGDTLALFLAREISEVCADETDLQEALECAERAVSAAAYELQELAEHLAMEARKEAIRKERKGVPST